MTTGRDVEKAAGVLAAVSTALDGVDWGDLVAACNREESIGPILDPSRFMAHGDNVRRNKQLFEATRDYVATLHRIHEEAMA